MTLVRFLKEDGSLDREVVAAAGANLLDVAQANGQPLEGACEGSMACSTCHIIVDRDDFGRLPPASEEEDDLLDLAAHVSRTSRLACQITLTNELEQLTVRMPGGAYNLDR
ncbi:2Fe-2S iron-sulfur cluster-binding protein [Sphingomonas jaspsi]|uniref:2Fe-2S iron-sulfur cluster-binding protein n=1 Tax=Sphingomonas jaspsi TaxID=392409 RepID=UPI0004BC6BDC|nr:2Fe-2S iron-sulfur cluster-binding protein [Sphingomonas jaspsi]